MFVGLLLTAGVGFCSSLSDADSSTRSPGCLLPLIIGQLVLAIVLERRDPAHLGDARPAPVLRLRGDQGLTSA